MLSSVLDSVQGNLLTCILSIAKKKNKKPSLFFFYNVTTNCRSTETSQHYCKILQIERK